MGAAIPGVGLGLQLVGGVMGFMGNRQAAEAQQRQIAAEQAIEQQRKQAMELDAQRRKLEIIRNQQRARAMALTVANSQGAAQGSGLAGAYGQIGGQTGVNYAGVQSALQTGRNIFGFNADISQARIDMSQAQSLSGMGSGLMSLGNSLVNTSNIWNNQLNNFRGKQQDMFNPWLPGGGGIY